jgi:hypothetical protein
MKQGDIWDANCVADYPSLLHTPRAVKEFCNAKFLS